MTPGGAGYPVGRAEKARRRVLILGLDGAEWKVIDPLLEQGALDDLLPLCLQRHVSVIAAGVFNSGLLAGSRPAPGAVAFHRTDPLDAQSRRGPRR